MEKEDLLSILVKMSKGFSLGLFKGLSKDKH